MFDSIINLVQDGFDNTFGQMNGKEVLWTIIGLLCLYQLLMIKWRLIDLARANRIPSSYLSRTRGLTPMRTNIGGGFGQSTNTPRSAPVHETVGFTPKLSGRLDMRRYSDVELAQDVTLKDLDRLNDLRGHMRSGGDGMDN